MSTRMVLCLLGACSLFETACFSDVPSVTFDDTTGSSSASESTAISSSSSSSESSSSSSESSSSSTDTDGESSATDGRTTTGSTGETGALDTSESSTGEPLGEWLDDFDRLDSQQLGNGWIESKPIAQSLVGGRVVGTPGLTVQRGETWPAHHWYRPLADHALDIEVSVEFQLQSSEIDSHPQLCVRMQPDELGPDAFRGYLLVIVNHTLHLDRYDGPTSTPMNELAVSLDADEFPQEGEWYRLRLRATGSEPVFLHGALESDVFGELEVIAELSGHDASDGRIDVAGSWGAGGGLALGVGNIHYDNFRAEFLD